MNHGGLLLYHPGLILGSISHEKLRLYRIQDGTHLGEFGSLLKTSVFICGDFCQCVLNVGFVVGVIATSVSMARSRVTCSISRHEEKNIY